LDETEVESQIGAQPIRTVVAALAAPVVVDEHKPMETFQEACLAVEHAFPGTMQGMLKHYKVSSVDQLVEAQRIDAEKLIAKKMGGAK
jgi:hypothetical protein